MQIFLPYSDFSKSVEVLDPSRLGNQIYREGFTIIKGKWKNHPVSRMWKGFEYALGLYLLAGLDELKKRGKDYAYHKPFIYEMMAISKTKDMPHFIGHEGFHACHRSNLLRKDPVWYGKFGWTEPHDLPYEWFSYRTLSKQ